LNDFEGQGHQGQKLHLSALLAACIWFVFGKTSLASSLVLLWLRYEIGQTIIFLPCGFFFFLSFFPRLISAIADWMSVILPHMVWP